MDKKIKSKRVYVLFGMYCILLIWIILFKLAVSVTDLQTMIGRRSINLLPFYYQKEVSFHFKEVLYNCLIFIPFGIYLKLLDVDAIKTIFSGLIFSFLLEFCQFVFKMGASDITDILTNTLGTAVGVMLYLVYKKLFKKYEKADRILEGLTGIVTIAFSGLALVLVIVN